MGELKIIYEQEVLGKNFKVYGSKEEPLFLAKDVAEWIEHSNVTMMLTSVDEDEKIQLNNPYLDGKSLGGNGKAVNFLTENGLYEVLMQSRKPIAKSFKKEVKQILKQIRLTGEYRKQDSYMIEDPVERARRWIEEQEEKQEKIEQQQLVITEQKEVIDSITNVPEGYKSFSEIADMFCIYSVNNQPHSMFVGAIFKKWFDFDSLKDSGHLIEIYEPYGNNGNRYSRPFVSSQMCVMFNNKISQAYERGYNVISVGNKIYKVYIGIKPLEKGED